MSKKLLGAGTCVLFSLALITGLANATSITPGIDFSGGSGGTVSFDGTTFAVSSAPISQVENLRTSTIFGISGGTLDFFTAPCDKNCTLGGGISTDSFANGGLLQIFGTVLGPGTPSGLLLQGTFDDSQSLPQFGQSPCPLTTVTLNSSTGNGGFRGCLDISNINSTLLTDLGLPGFDTAGNGFLSELLINISFNGSTFSGSVSSTDLAVTPKAAEPATLALVGAGLLLLGNLGRKRLLTRHVVRPIGRA
jgi:hypothetical protein